MHHYVHINYWRTRDILSHVLNYSISLIYNNISNYNVLAIRERLSYKCLLANVLSMSRFRSNCSILKVMRARFLRQIQDKECIEFSFISASFATINLHTFRHSIFISVNAKVYKNACEKRPRTQFIVFLSNKILGDSK